MPQEIPWRKTLGARLGAALLALLVAVLLVIGGNLYLLASIRNDSSTINLLGKGRYRAYQAFALTQLLLEEKGPERKQARTADRIAGGELDPNAGVGGSDELAVLGSAFDGMTAKLRSTLQAEKEGREKTEEHLRVEKKTRARVERLLESIREAVNQL